MESLIYIFNISNFLLLFLKDDILILLYSSEELTNKKTNEIPCTITNIEEKIFYNEVYHVGLFLNNLHRYNTSRTIFNKYILKIWLNNRKMRTVNDEFTTIKIHLNQSNQIIIFPEN